MAGRKGPKAVVDKAEASKTTGITSAEIATGTAEAAATAATAQPVIIEPRAPEPRDKEVVLPSGRVEKLEGEVQEADENQYDKDKKDGEITDQARELRKLEQFQQDITRLQQERDQLMHQATT